MSPIFWCTCHDAPRGHLPQLEEIRDEALVASLWEGVKSPNFSRKYDQYELDRGRARKTSATVGATTRSIAGALFFPGCLRHCLNSIPQIVDREPQRVGDDLHGVEGWVGFAVFNTAQVRLVEAAALPKLRLAQAGIRSQLPNASPESLCQCFFHLRNYPGYALNHINTNSYI